MYCLLIFSALQLLYPTVPLQQFISVYWPKGNGYRKTCTATEHKNKISLPLRIKPNSRTLLIGEPTKEKSKATVLQDYSTAHGEILNTEDCHS